MKPINEDVHRVAYSGHNEIQILCDGSWDTSKWGDQKEIDAFLKANYPSGVYLADTDRLYTFDSKSVTCKKCKE